MSSAVKQRDIIVLWASASIVMMTPFVAEILDPPTPYEVAICGCRINVDPHILDVMIVNGWWIVAVPEAWELSTLSSVNMKSFILRLIADELRHLDYADPLLGDFL
jgi:hypothetical protein